MDSGQLLYSAVKIGLGALTAVFAIAVWSRTREAPWLFVVLGILAFYSETLWSILGMFGIGAELPAIYAVPLPSLIFCVLPPIFFIIAFIIMLIKKTRL